MKILKSIFEYVSDIRSVIRSDIPLIHNKMVEMNSQEARMQNSLNVLARVQEKQNKQISEYANQMLGKDSEFIIYHGKKYMITQTELTEDKPETEPAQLRVWCTGV